MNVLKNILSNTWVRCALLMITFLILAFFFVSPGLDYYSQDATYRDLKRPLSGEPPSGYKSEDERQQAVARLPASDSRTDQLMKDEHQKAVDEIKLRLEQQDSWYHYKFLIIGGMFAVFLGQTGLNFGRRPHSPSAHPKRFNDILTAASNYSILTLAVVIALAIDMHIRNNMFGMQTIGLWIAHY